MTNQRRNTGSRVKIVGEIGKSSYEHEREQKFRQTSYPLSREHPLHSSKKPTEDGSQQTIHEQFVNPVLITQKSCS